MGRKRTFGAPFESSTGFAAPEAEVVELPDSAQRMADRCRPYSDCLTGHPIMRTPEAPIHVVPSYGLVRLPLPNRT
jgi:hypothetical protein